MLISRLACVDLAEFPLQVLLRRERSWCSKPAVVVENDRPQGVILFANDHARREGVLPGHSYAAGLSLCRNLRAAVVSPEEIEKATTPLIAELRHYSPDIEPAEDDPGVFWLDASGLAGLYPSLEDWGRRIVRALRRQDLQASVVTGYTRFGTYAAARSLPTDVRVFHEPEHEREQLGKAALCLLGLAPRVRDLLQKLGVRTVGDLLKLPPDGIRRRFGPETWLIYRRATGILETPLTPLPPAEPVLDRLVLDQGIDRADQILLAVETLLLPLLAKLQSGSRAMTALVLDLLFERSDSIRETIRTAEPSSDASQILGLLLLRLEHLRLPEGVIEIGIELENAPIRSTQGELFSSRPARDLSAGNRALARVRARFGESSVRCLGLREGHLPEARMRWQPFAKLETPVPREVHLPSLVRRYYSPPLPLAPRSRHEPDGWILNGPEAGSVTRTQGPYIVSGGWWARGVHRDYYFAETGSGGIYWVFYDRGRRQWFLHGVVS